MSAMEKSRGYSELSSGLLVPTSGGLDSLKQHPVLQVFIVAKQCGWEIEVEKQPGLPVGLLQAVMNIGVQRGSGTDSAKPHGILDSLLSGFSSTQRN